MPDLGALELRHVVDFPQVLKDGPGQWQTYYWMAAGGVIIFIPRRLAFL